VYSGHIARLAFGNGDIHLVAGSFVSLAGSFATPQRCVYGWYAIGPGW
jgi:hypothetical protein